MPAGIRVSAYQRVREQAQIALRKIQTDIRDRETELAVLGEQEQALSSFLGAQTKGAGPAPARGLRRRVDWRAVLTNIPRQFKAADVRKVPGMAGKRTNEIFAGITRWIDAKLVTRKERGLYEKTK